MGAFPILHIPEIGPSVPGGKPVQAQVMQAPNSPLKPEEPQTTCPRDHDHVPDARRNKQVNTEQAARDRGAGGPQEDKGQQAPLASGP